MPDHTAHAQLRESTPVQAYALLPDEGNGKQDEKIEVCFLSWYLPSNIHFGTQTSKHTRQASTPERSLKVWNLEECYKTHSKQIPALQWNAERHCSI